MNRKRIDSLYFVTESEHKFNDYQFLLGKYANLRWANLRIEEPMTTDLDILIRRKVELVRPSLPHLHFLVEQTNLMIKVWRDLPGNLTSQFIRGVGVNGICKMLHNFDDRSATVVTNLAYHAPDGAVAVFSGEIHGRIPDQPEGTQLYGWDAIFIPDSYDRTFAEMPLEQRNNISTRKLSVAALIETALQGQEADLLLQNRIKLRQLMMRYFSKTDLETLIFDLGIDRGYLPDGLKTELAQEIILYCERHGLITQLLEMCRRQRPNAEWPDNI